MNWLDNKSKFKVIDVRSLKGNFLPSVTKRANATNVGEGLCIIQSFEPIPLYSLMHEMGFEHSSEKISDVEYHVYFFRTENKTQDQSENTKLPFKPTAIVNFNSVNPKLANIVVNFWDHIWGQEDSAIDMKTKLLLSLANGVGAGRMKQAVREFVKAYSIGVTTNEFDELFSMFAWNQGVGYFASEIGPSALFKAYKHVKSMEEKGNPRDEIIASLLDKFGESNPNVNTFATGKRV